MGVEHPHADVKGGIVVQHAHFSRIGRLGPDLRVALGEISGRSRRCSGRLVEYAVDANGAGATRGAHYPRLPRDGSRRRCGAGLRSGWLSWIGWGLRRSICKREDAERSCARDKTS